MAKKKKKAKKKRAHKYEPKLSIKGSFDDVLKISIQQAEERHK